MSWDRVPRIEVVAGRYGFFSVANTNRIPLGGLVTLRNMTLADSSWRTGGGASKLGVTIPGAFQIVHAIDFWPTPDKQRTVVVASNGGIYKDDGTGQNWVSIIGGITQGGLAIPHFTVAGAEAAGQARKLFYLDRVHIPQVLVGDGAAFALITKPAADWAGANQPGWSVAHQGYHWAGGNLNAPHTVYRSLASDHQDFKTQPYTLLCGPESQEQYTVSGLSFKGGIIVGKFPIGTYFIDTSSDLDPLHWTAQRVALPGWAGPHAGGLVEDGVIWMAPDGSWHSITAQFGIAKASIRATSLTYRKLTSWPRQHMNLTQVALSDFIYYSDGQELMLTYADIDSVQLNRRLHLDLNNQDEVGENWETWDRDLNSCLFLRQLASGRTVPAFGDYSGQLWLLDQAVRSKDGAAYTAEFFMADTDFAPLYPAWSGRKKNGRFVAVEYVSTTDIPMTLEVWQDGRKTQSIPLTLKAKGAGGSLQITPSQRLLGQFNRLAIRGLATVVGDLDVTRLILGCELAA